MIKLTKLTMRNFLSYGNNTTTVNLQFDKPTLIVGKNYDSAVDGQTDSNGAGKSTILNAIAFCGFDKTIADIDKNNLVNYTNTKNMEVTLEFSKNNVYYKIQRYRKNKPLGGDGVRLFINEKEPVFHMEHDKTPDSVSNTNDKIVEIIGIPFEIFSRIVIFSATYEPFLALPSSHASKPNQRDIIEELFGLTELTRKAEKLKEFIKTTNADIKAVSLANNNIEAERLRYKNQLDSTILKQEAWEVAKQASISNYDRTLKSYKSIDVDSILKTLAERDKVSSALTALDVEQKSISKELHTILQNNKQKPEWDASNQRKIDTKRSTIIELSKIDVPILTKVRDDKIALNAKLKPLNEEMIRIDDSIEEYNTEYKKLKNDVIKLTDKICPYCNQDFKDVKAKLDETNKRIKQLDALIVTATDDSDLLNEEIESIGAELRKLNVYTIPSNLKEIESTINSLEVECTTLSNLTNPFTITPTEDIENELELILNDIEEWKGKLSDVNDILKKYPTTNELGEWTEQKLIKIQSSIEAISNEMDLKTKEINPFTSIVDELADNLEHNIPNVDNDKFDELHITLEHQEFLLKLLTKKDSFVRKALLNKNIPFLNSRLAHYLESIGLKHKVLFTEEMGAHVKYLGTEYHYGNLSAGQMARVNIALSFAFRDVLQARFDKINFCILDECLDVGLGNVGIQLAAKMIKSIASTDKLSMLVISHRDEIVSMFDSILEVELKNGFSNIVPSLLSSTEEFDE